MRYGGGFLPGVPTRSELLRADPAKDKARRVVARRLMKQQAVLFMPVDVTEGVEYVQGQPQYRLRLWGCTRDGAKTLLELRGVPVFFDVRVPAGRDPEDFRREVLSALSSGAQEGDDSPYPLPPGAAARSSENPYPDWTEVVGAVPVNGYRPPEAGPASYVRLQYHAARGRDRALRVLHKARPQYETAADDVGKYYKKAAREAYLPVTDWLVVQAYEWTTGGAHSHLPDDAQEDTRSDAWRYPLAEHVLRADLGSVRAFVPCFGAEPDPAAEAKRQDTPALARDATVVATFDIETWSPGRTGAPPSPDEPDDRAFMIALTFHWKDDPRPAAQVVLVDVETEPDPGWTTVVCGDQRNLLLAFGEVMRAWAPDVVTGFNCGGYDWPFIVAKAQQEGVLAQIHEAASAERRARPSDDKEVARWKVRRLSVKISPERITKVAHLCWPGTVPLDTRVAFMRIDPRAEKTSLRFFLERNGLEGKEDMAYTRMHQIYEEALSLPAAKKGAGTAAGRGPPGKRGAAAVARDMRAVARYCLVDALRCQELLVRRNVVNEAREVGSLSFTCLYDCLYYAVAGRVGNMLAAHAGRAGLACTLRSNDVADHEKGLKYEGAYVIPPRKGLYRDRPITGLDFASLYPSIIMAYNLSPERYIPTAAEAERLRPGLEARGLGLHEVSFEYDGRPVRSWFARHGGAAGEMGLFPRVLKGLFDRRKQLKKGLKVFSSVEEHCDLLLARVRAGEPFAAVAEELAALLARAGLPSAPGAGEAETRGLLAELRFRTAALDSKQKALKVFMNSFYGTAGSKTSPWFLLPLAGGVTAAGRYNLKLVHRFVTARDYDVIYGDTDSLYLCCPPASYAAERQAWETSPGTPEDYERYCAAIVRKTMRELGALRDEVNAHLERDNGTKFLNMAYEEVLFPSVYLGKKKYYGIAHEEVPNFRPKKLFIKGVDCMKQGQTPLSAEMGRRIMWRSVELRRPGRDPRPSMLEIVEEVVREALTNRDQWRFEDFVQTASWRPEAQNLSVQHFMRRMARRHEAELEANRRLEARGRPGAPLRYLAPEPGERFAFVVMEQPAVFSLAGKRLDGKRKGDRMEYVEVARALIAEGRQHIDLPFYFTSYVVGLCTRFVSFDAAFAAPEEVEQAWARGDEAVIELDKRASLRAKQHLTRFVKALAPGSAPADQARGRAYRQIWTRARAQATEALLRSAETSEARAALRTLAGRAELAAEWAESGDEAPVRAFVADLLERAEEPAPGKGADGRSAEEAYFHRAYEKLFRDIRKAPRVLYALAASRRNYRGVSSQIAAGQARDEAALRARFGTLVAATAPAFWAQVSAAVERARGELPPDEKKDAPPPAAEKGGGPPGHKDGGAAVDADAPSRAEENRAATGAGAAPPDGPDPEALRELEQTYRRLQALALIRRRRRWLGEQLNRLKAKCEGGTLELRANPGDPYAPRGANGPRRPK